MVAVIYFKYTSKRYLYLFQPMYCRGLQGRGFNVGLAQQCLGKAVGKLIRRLGESGDYREVSSRLPLVMQPVIRAGSYHTPSC